MKQTIFGRKPSGSRSRRAASGRRLLVERLESKRMLSGDPLSAAGTGSVSNSPGHHGDSPFAPPKADDATFTVDQGAGLDQYTFRGGGPLLIDLPTSRYFGNIANLRAAKLIGDYVTLQLPAYDVDYASPPGFNGQPERDIVSFNGHLMSENPANSKYLTGADGQWTLNTFQIPISWIMFPTDPGAGKTLAPADNIVRVDIDTANPVDQDWATSIDWVSMTIPAPEPVLLVHGILSSAATWSPVWVGGLDNLGIPEARIDLGGPLGIALDSISNNSAKIAAKVAALQQEWGVKMLNIVSHSKGGVDSRDYVETHNTIGTLVQIGSPNAGSPLADFVEFVAAVGIGSISPSLYLGLNALLPATYELTTPYMAFYNFTHGHNANTKYVSLAGDYQPGPFLDDTYDNILAAIVGRGDTVVPISSALSLPYATHLTFSSTYPNIEATHTSETKSAGIFAQLVPYVEGLAPGGSSGVGPNLKAVATPIEPQAGSTAQTATVPGTVTRGQVATQSVEVDGTNPADFSLYYNAGTLGFSLVSPSGRVIDPSTPGTDSDISYSVTAEGDLGTFVTYHVGKPEAGNWTTKVTGTALPVGVTAAPFFVTGWLTNPTRSLSASADQASYHAGDPIVIHVDLRGVGAATITAKVALPDGSFATVPMHDDGKDGDATAGDGIDSAELPDSSQAGLYRVIVTATGTGADPFTRQTMVVVGVSASSSRLTGTDSDRAADSDGDEIDDSLDIGVGANITRAGSYRLIGTLTGSDGTSIASATFAGDLLPGQQSLGLSFDGRAISESGIDGPYHLTSVVLSEDDGATSLPDDSAIGTYTTASYSHDQFEHDADQVTGLVSDRGTGPDANGRFSGLDVTFGVDVANAGSYSWTGSLADASGNVLDSASGAATLGAGAGMITLSFAGTKIGDSHQDGPYHISNLMLFDGSGSSPVATGQAASSSYYSYRQFESTGLSLNPISPQSVDEQSPVTFKAVGIDPEVGRKLTYSLGPDAPAGSAIDPSTGVFTWTPSEARGPGKHTFTVRVADDAATPLSDSEPVTITVLANASGPVPSLSVSAGPAAILPLGANLSRVGSFSELQANGPFVATIDYGDGAGPQSLALNADRSFAIDHLYASAGLYTVHVSISVPQGPIAIGTFPVAIILPATTLATPAGPTAVSIPTDLSPVALGRYATIATLYRDVLGRGPDGPGLAYWVGRLGSGSSVAILTRQFFQSSEYQALASQGQAPTATYSSVLADASAAGRRSAMVATLYREVLGRAPDPAGYGGYLDRLASGASPAQVANLMANATGSHPTSRVKAKLAVTDALRNASRVSTSTHPRGPL